MRSEYNVRNVVAVVPPATGSVGAPFENEAVSLKQAFALALTGLCAIVGSGAEPLVWPQFRGPAGSGIADGQKPPVVVGPTKNVKWKVPVPGGSSSPIVAGNLLVLTAFENNKLYTIAYARTDGKE